MAGAQAIRLASYERDGQWAAALGVAGDRLVDAGAAARHAGLDDGVAWSSVRAIVAQDAGRLAALNEAAGALAANGDGDGVLAAADAHLGPPVPDPQKILCIGLNYRAHANEAALDEPTVPMVFAKFPNVLIGSGASIELPEGHGEKVDYEGEIAVVIGRRAYRRSEEDALDVVAGWMPFNDVSARDVQTLTSQWTVGKSPDTFGPCGPYLVLDDALGDGGLEIETQVNGERVQHANSDRMIFSVARLIAFLTTFITLEPGDIVVTGTPEGVGAHRDPPRFLRDGDVVRGARQRRAPVQPGPPPRVGPRSTRHEFVALTGSRDASASTPSSSKPTRSATSPAACVAMSAASCVRCCPASPPEDVQLTRARAQPCGLLACSAIGARRRGHLAQRVTRSLSFSRSDWRTMSALAGSPCSSARAKPLACSKRMCGGSGGTSGSVTTSRTTGRSAASARSQAGPTSPGASTRMPSRPSWRA